VAAQTSRDARLFVSRFPAHFLSTKSLYTLNFRWLSRMSNRCSISSVTVSISRDVVSIFLFSLVNWRFISLALSPPSLQNRYLRVVINKHRYKQFSFSAYKSHSLSQSTEVTESYCYSIGVNWVEGGNCYP